VVECPTQTIGLTSLLYIIYYTGAKGSTQTNKKIKVRVQNKGVKETEENPGLVHRTVSGAPGAVQSELFTFGFLRCHSGIIHRTVLRATGLSGVTAEQRLGSATVDSNVACNVNSALTVRADSEQRQKAHQTVNSAYPVRHRTVRCPKKLELQQSKPAEP
jgi:hypothetical protein